MKNKLQDKKWYTASVAACIAVVLYVVLTHLGPIGSVIHRFTGYFGPVILGLILAYLMNPLAKLYQRKLFGRLKKESLRWTLSVILAVITAIVVLFFLLGILIPQLAASIATLVNNMDSYVASLEAFLSKHGWAETLKIDKYIDSLFGVNGKVVTYLKENSGSILNASAAAGKGLIKWVIAFVLSVYVLMSKDSMRHAMLRLMHAVLPERAYQSTLVFLKRCDNILVNYIAFSLLDSILIGVINALFMIVMRMDYVGLVSLVVAVMNLIPTFGPVIGAVIGGFILLLVNPVHALIFIIFTLVLQFFDGYLIKPKLFGNKLGVSGLLILASIIVCGNIWGIVGILLAIPIAAILDFSVRDEIMPALERRRAKSNAVQDVSGKKDDDHDPDPQKEQKD